MPDYSSNNKRIAKNTVFLYFRMILVLGVSLYTSRVILHELGVVDYGIYNVVAGVIVMFSFLNSSMATSTQRFLTFELGKGNIGKLASTFAASLNIHIAIGVVIFLMAETIGLWFVNYKLVIPIERMNAANIAYQCSVISFMLNITQVPYTASLIAHEKMDIYAYLGILEAVVKLGIAFSLVIYGSDKLIFFSLMILLTHGILLMLYRLFCVRRYQECHFKLFWDSKLYKNLTFFAGWNIFGSLAWACRGQGVSILLNLFFGPQLNAAKGIADKVSHSVMAFIRNFNIAMNPQITKNYAVGDIIAMENLCFKGTKFAFLLMFIIAFPAMLNIDYLLNLWLVEVPNYTTIFVILIMADSLLDVFLGTSQFITALQATGNIKYYQIVVSALIMLIIPSGYLLFKLGGSPDTILYAMIAVSLLSGLARFAFCKYQIGFSIRRLCLKSWIPIFRLLLFSMLPLLLLKSFSSTYLTGFKGFLLTTIVSVVFIAVCAWVTLLTKSEKDAVWSEALRKINRK